MEILKTEILKSWGTSSLGLPIWAYHIHVHGGEQKKRLPVLVLGGVHGDEVEGVVAAQILLQRMVGTGDFLKGPRSPLSNLVKVLDLVIVPVLNPDGVLNKQRCNGRGVDLNRNLPTKDWSSQTLNPRYPPGPFPGSEPENQGLIRYIEEEKPLFILSLHSWKPLLNVNGACRKPAEIISQRTGYRIEESIGYPTPGCLGTYAGLERQSPTLTYEIERGLSWEEIHRIHVPAIEEGLGALVEEMSP